MIFFCGKVKDLKPALEKHFNQHGSENIENAVLWFGVCRLDQFDMIDLDGSQVLNQPGAIIPLDRKSRGAVKDINKNII